MTDTPKPPEDRPTRRGFLKLSAAAGCSACASRSDACLAGEPSEMPSR